MKSSPPTARDAESSPRPRFCETTFRAHAADESLLFFCVEDAPRSACRTEVVGAGLRFATTLEGVVDASSADSLVMVLPEGKVSIHHLLPSAIDLAPLSGHLARFEIEQHYAERGRATIDTAIYDAEGDLVLWARDGRAPADRDSHGLTLRVSLGGAHRLAVAHLGGVSSVGAPDLARVRTADGTFDLLVLRLGAEDVSFVLARR